MAHGSVATATTSLRNNEKHLLHNKAKQRRPHCGLEIAAMNSIVLAKAHRQNMKRPQGTARAWAEKPKGEWFLNTPGLGPGKEEK